MDKPADQTAKRILLVPLDPVHDVGIKLIGRELSKRGHEVSLLPPDLSVEEAVARANVLEPDFLMVSRTISYGTGELLAKFVDLCDASGLRQKTTLVVGGLSIRPEMAQEFGFDAGFGPDTSPGDVGLFVEGRKSKVCRVTRTAEKRDLTHGFTYEFKDEEIGGLCLKIARQLLDWASQRTTPAIERARTRVKIEEAKAKGDIGAAKELRGFYASLCDGQVRNWYDTGQPVANTRPLSHDELRELGAREERVPVLPKGQEVLAGHNVLVQYGTGCPVMDSYHIRLSLAWGAGGVVHFDPSWGARAEGLLEGEWSHAHDGTLLTLENLKLIRGSVHPGGLWQVRAHRGLNTPETVVLGHLAGADLTKINIVYGSLGAGTDPARLAVDGVEAMRLAAGFTLPFDVVTNEELCGVPASKAFAGMLIVASAGILLGGRPILQPLFANSPEAMIKGFSEDNYIDFNAAKIMVLQGIIDAPVWPGAPVGFLTQTQDRCQSATMTALHAALALSLGAQAVTIASSDEAYAGGPISGGARVDTLNSTAAALRFLGGAKFQPTEEALGMAAGLRDDILDVLERVALREDFVSALYEGLLGDEEDGAYPGRAGKDTVRMLP